MSFKDFLKENGACVAGFRAHSHQTTQEFWDSCQRADWVLWVAARKMGEDGWPTHEAVVKMACAFARRCLDKVPKGEERPRLAIEAAERWAENPTEENRNAAYAAYAAYAAEAANAAAYAAAYAAYAAYAAEAANAAAYAANAAEAANAERKAQCGIIRAIWPKVGE